MGIETQFRVKYNLSSGQAFLTLKSHNADAESHGVRYQIGYAHREEDNVRLSQPMNIDEAKNVEIETNILSGGYLVIHVMDNEGHIFTAAKVDKTCWPSANSGQSVYVGDYNLPVEQD